MKKIIPLAVLSLATLGSAQAASVNVLGGLNFQNDSVTPQAAGVTTSAKSALVYGATVEFGFFPALALEVGALSVGSKTKMSTSAGDVTISSRAVVIPVMVRFTALPVLDFGVGAYYGILPSKFTVEGSTIPGIANGEATATTAAKSDFGVRVGARAKLPIAPMLSGLIDVSYNYGLKDTDTTAATSEKTRAYSLMAGVSLGF